MTIYSTMIYFLFSYGRLVFFCTGAEAPTYLREPSDKTFVTVGFVGIGLGVVLALKGLVQMTFGLNKVAR